MAGRSRREGEPVAPWCCGWARFWVDQQMGSHVLTVAAQCRFGSQRGVDRALIDTGAQWSVIGGELARQVEADAFAIGEDVVLTTRLGTARGRFFFLDVTVVAEEGGHLLVPATVVLAPSWLGPPVLGYRGFLDRIRFGFDPGDGPEDQWVFFGSAG
jgi:hypothetical protein